MLFNHTVHFSFHQVLITGCTEVARAGKPSDLLMTDQQPQILGFVIHCLNHSAVRSHSVPMHTSNKELDPEKVLTDQPLPTE